MARGEITILVKVEYPTGIQRALEVLSLAEHREGEVVLPDALFESLLENLHEALTVSRAVTEQRRDDGTGGAA